MKKYVVVTYSHDSGYDEKMDYDSIKEARREAKEYAKDSYYECVTIYKKGEPFERYDKAGLRWQMR